MLERSELSRYSRNILLSGVGRSGQEKLKSSRVLVIGAGGLGSPVLLYLAAAGVGHIRFMEADRLDLTNLQRQILYSTHEVGNSKGQVAREHLQQLNPNIEIDLREERFDTENALEALEGMDLVLETTDSIPAKFLTNDAAYFAGRPALIGGVLRYHGTIIAPGRSSHSVGRPCYRCLFPSAPPSGAVPTCADAGVLGAMAGLVGSAMAAEALKILLEVGEPLSGHLLQFDMLESSFRRIPFSRDPLCPLCGDQPSILELKEEPLLAEEEDFLDRLPRQDQLP
ncbi:MAG: HesA/MoeB/ThiF family protein [Leptospiraceae bacterium]|nr:HesA/MoeB/ThiF family protein [Leptospiraceae bacterium]